jgi:20S proteasome alpha/beta subunit
VAALFRWNVGPRDAPSYKIVAITASDRKITAGDVEYEPQQQKLVRITPRILILVAGELALHSEAIIAAHKQIKGNADVSPQNVALIYGQALQAIKRRHAEDIYLSPLGLNTDTFIGQQRDLSEGFIDKISRQMQMYGGDVGEALVVGGDGENAHIWLVDENGCASCLDDVGFAAIGSGAWHAKSRLMQMGYVNSLVFAPALAASFAAKKAAEVAPGVGSATDLNVVFHNVVETLRPDVVDKLHEIYASYIQERTLLDQKAVAELQSFVDNLNTPTEPKKNDIP